MKFDTIFIFKLKLTCFYVFCLSLFHLGMLLTPSVVKCPTNVSSSSICFWSMTLYVLITWTFEVLFFFIGKLNIELRISNFSRVRMEIDIRFNKSKIRTNDCFWPDLISKFFHFSHKILENRHTLGFLLLLKIDVMTLNC